MLSVHTVGTLPPSTAAILFWCHACLSATSQLDLQTAASTTSVSPRLLKPGYQSITLAPFLSSGAVPACFDGYIMVTWLVPKDSRHVASDVLGLGIHPHVLGCFIYTPAYSQSEKIKKWFYHKNDKKNRRKREEKGKFSYNHFQKVLLFAVSVVFGKKTFLV